jgi:drug/metabolite transporter (DMT)-like permease
MRQPKLIDYTLLVILALIWASAFFNIKIATESFGPITIAFLRVFFWINSSIVIMFLQKN